ncbi:methyltransferase domain-containing protein [Jiangella muralis]|uniref:methyltransferase domain-containing protein n=1 Tax=Jiangella muralis TaxID=702383 RepID=UPI00069D02ED
MLLTESRDRTTLTRSVRLFRAFLSEQRDPDHFYGVLAADSVAQLSVYADLRETLVLDVGGGPGYFRDAFRRAGARYLSVDSDLGELSARGEPEPGSVMGSGMALPIRDGAADVCYSSNVLEHVPDPWTMAEEMLRVTRPGGIVYLSFTVWLSPWGGHETAPWHYLGGESAARRYRRRHGHEPKNRFGASLFPVSVADALLWARHTPHGELLDAFPRYHPWWARGVVRVPGLRELATWNLAVVLRRR